MRRWVGLALLLSLPGCPGWTPAPGETVSYGDSSDGVLLDGRRLADRGEGYERARPGEDTRFATPRLLAALERAAREVATRFPGTAALRIADLSGPGGGRHPRHASHRTGRDADVIFYATDPAGRSVPGRGWLAFNRFGVAVERESREVRLFDDARNWHFARTLLLDEEAAVQWLFVSRGVKARLLRYGMAVEDDPSVLARAAYALHQPGDSSPHDDHFHVRVYCTTRELAYGCRNRGMVWSWLRATEEKPDVAPGAPLDDAALLSEVLDPIEGTEDAQE